MLRFVRRLEADRRVPAALWGPGDVILRDDVGRQDGKTLLLATWLSPAFPIGAFSYSHGLETAIANGRLRTAAAVHDWVAAILISGSGWNDAVFLAEAWRAGLAADPARITDVAALGVAM